MGLVRTTVLAGVLCAVGCGASSESAQSESDTSGVDTVGCDDPPSAPMCEAVDAVGVGACKAILGWVWNGLECVALSGCECEGSGCCLLASEEECQAETADCL